MTASRDPDRLIHAFLREGAEQLHDQVYDAVRAEIEQRRQRAVIGPWRVPTLNKLVPIGLAAAAVVAVLVVAFRLVGPPTSSIGGPGVEQTPTQSPSAAAPSAAAPSAAAGGSIPEGPFVLTQPADGTPSITVTIATSGWSHLPQFAAIEKGVEKANLPEATILGWTFPAGTGFYVFGDPCRSESTKPDNPVTTVDEIVDGLAAQASRDASEAADVTVGGYTGRSITLHVPADAVPDECEQGEFASYGTEADPLARFHQGPGQIDEFWFVDVDGAIVMLDAMYRPDTSAELVEEMRTIAESATFEAP